MTLSPSSGAHLSAALREGRSASKRRCGWPVKSSSGASPTRERLRHPRRCPLPRARRPRLLRSAALLPATGAAAAASRRGALERPPPAGYKLRALTPTQPQIHTQGAAASSAGNGSGSGAGSGIGEEEACKIWTMTNVGCAAASAVRPHDPEVRVRVFCPELDNPLLWALLYDKQYAVPAKNPLPPNATAAAGGRGEAAGAATTGRYHSSRQHAAGGGGGACSGGAGGAGVSGDAPASNGKRKLMYCEDVGEEEKEEDDDDDDEDIVNRAGGSERGHGGGRGGPITLTTLLRGIGQAGNYDGASGMAGRKGGTSSSGLPHRSNGKRKPIARVGVDDDGEDTNSVEGARGSEREHQDGGDPQTGANYVPGGCGGSQSVVGGDQDTDGGPSGGLGAPGEQLPPCWEQEMQIARPRLVRMAGTHALDRLEDIDQFGLFRQPVTGVDGYTEVIKHPMDFATIRRRLQRGKHPCIHHLAKDMKLVCTNAMTFNAPGDLHYTEARKLDAAAELIWPEATKFFDELLLVETTAALHGMRGPAVSSDAWPLDGPFTSFERTVANADAYYTYVTIKRLAAVAQVQFEHAKGAPGEDIDAAIRAALMAASSPAMLYTRQPITQLESFFLASLSEHNAAETQKALRLRVGSAKCEPIESESRKKLKTFFRPPPTPVTRKFMNVEREFLERDPTDQEMLVGPDPQLARKAKVAGVGPVAVVPEFQVHRSALMSRNKKNGKYHLLKMQKLLAKVSSESKTRLRVAKSTVQGFGVFATKPIAAHEAVLEFVGKVVDFQEAKNRVEAYCTQNRQKCIVRLRDDPPAYIDATRAGNMCRFINHLCAPNLYRHTVIAGVGQAEVRRVCLFSLRDIREGEEICYAYPAPHTVGHGERTLLFGSLAGLSLAGREECIEAKMRLACEIVIERKPHPRTATASEAVSSAAGSETTPASIGSAASSNRSSSSNFTPGGSRAAASRGLQAPVPLSAANMQGAAAASAGNGSGSGAGAGIGEEEACKIWTMTNVGCTAASAVRPHDPEVRVRVFCPELDNPLLRALLYDKQYAVPAKNPLPPKATAAAGGRGEAAGSATTGRYHSSRQHAAGGGGGGGGACSGGAGGAGVSGDAPASKGKRKLMYCEDVGEEEEEEEEEEEDDDDDIVNRAGGSERGHGGGRGGPITLTTLLRGIGLAGNYDGASGMAGRKGGTSSSGLPHRSNGKRKPIARVGVDDDGEDTNSVESARGSEREHQGGGNPQTGANYVPGGGGGSQSVVGGDQDTDGGPSGGLGAPGEQLPPCWEQEMQIARPRLVRMAGTHALDRLEDIDQFGLFRQPVTGVDGYTEVIKHPMDFATIRRRLQRGKYPCIHHLAKDMKLVCTNAMTFNAPGDLHYTEARKLDAAAELIWPEATKFFDELLLAETTAALHGMRGPAVSSDAWPLDGPFTSFERTVANADAYYTYVTIKRLAAVAQVQFEHAKGAPGEDIDAAIRAALMAASSPAMLYTRQPITQLESFFLASLSEHNAAETQKALRLRVGSAKCEPIESESRKKLKTFFRPPPTPVTRKFMNVEREFLERDPTDQEILVGPDPQLARKAKVTGVGPVAVVPEFQVHRSALMSRNKKNGKYHLLKMQKLLAKVSSESKTRLRVAKSTVQGFGVFATKPIAAHEAVLEFVGEVVDFQEAKNRVEAYCAQNRQKCIVRLRDDPPAYIDATRAGNMCRFINHSCAPNLYRHTVVAGVGQAEVRRVCLFSLRDIREGEEICYAYPAPHTVGLGERRFV
eukprot:g10027.t1